MTERGISMRYSKVTNSELLILFIGVCLIAVFASRDAIAVHAALDWPTLKNKIQRSHPDVPQIQTEELDRLLTSEEDEKPLLIDVREKREFEVSHLKGAKRAKTVREALKILGPAPANRFIVLYCAVGFRSSALAEKLQDRGYTRVYNLEGSIFKWTSEQRPIYREDELTDKVHPFSIKWGHLIDRSYWSTAPE